MNVIYENGIKREVDNYIIRSLVEDELYNYSKADRGVIADCVSLLMSDIKAEHDSDDVSLERKFFDAVKMFLEDGYSVYQLDHLEDKFEILENVQNVCISKISLNDVISSCEEMSKKGNEQAFKEPATKRER